MILIDSNVPMYLVGADHPHKVDAQRELERFLSDRERLVTDAEVFQEMLHRYVAIDRRRAIQPAFDVLRAVADEVLPITESEVIAAKDVAAGHLALSARDALHVAVMHANKIPRIFSFDRGFDAVPGIQRLP
jgi:predicted nucleic acid-binding protein